MPGAAGAEEGTALDAGSLDVFGDGLGRAEVNSFGFDVTAFDMKAQRCLVTVLMEVGDLEPAAGFDARASIEIELQYGSVTQVQERVAGRHRHKLPRPGFRERTGFIDGIGGLARDELRMGGIGHGDRQRSRSPQELVNEESENRRFIVFGAACNHASLNAWTSRMETRSS